MFELKNILLFKGMTEGEISSALDNLKSREKNFHKGEFILHAGGSTEQMGIVLDGSVTIEMNDAWGNRTILSHIGSGGFFAETYALLKGEVLLVDALANEDCRILFLNLSSLRDPENSDPWKQKLIINLLSICASKNLTLSGRSFHTSSRTIRAKILSYLNAVSLKKHSNEFDIPFDRQQLADYLNVERTALSKELSKMRNEQLIDFRKSHFKLLV